MEFNFPNPDLPDLTRPEWTVILDAMNGVIWHHDLMEAMGQPAPISIKAQTMANVADEIRINRMDLKHGVNGDVLLTKLENLTDEEWEKVKAVITGFWDDGGYEKDDTIPGR